VTASLDLPDDELWSAAVRGDPDAFGALFLRHRDRVFGHARRIVDIATDAEDVTALVFLEAWRKRSSVRVVDGSLLPWLLVTANYMSLNLVRTRNRRSNLMKQLRPALAENPEEIVIERLIHDDRQDRFRSALGKLSRKDREIVALRVIEEISVEATAKTLGLSISATKTRLSRARQRLGVLLAEEPARIGDEHELRPRAE
jgi:RNA polymerase sigma-70 factor (ECF subfamily)